MAGIDAIAKRYHPFIVGGLLATVAYFQGRGISSLIAEQLPIAAPVAAAQKKATQPATRTKSASEILARNPFDSVTGPLGTKPPPPASSSAKPTERPSSQHEPPKCANGEVTLIAGALDPKYSFAVITTNNQSKMRRIGDDVDGKKVESIHGESVIIGTGSERCRLTMHEAAKTATGGGAVVPPTESPAGDESAPPARAIRGAPMSGIRKVSDTEYVIEENGPQKMASMKQAFLKAAKLVDGQGLRLYRAAQTTILGQLGLKKGDMVKTINGFDMSSADQSAEAYAKLAESSNVKIVVERDGSPVTLDYTVSK